MNDFRLSKDVRPARYSLRFDLDLDTWSFRGNGTIGLRLARPVRSITLHSVDLDIATGDGVAAVTYDEEAETATLTLETELAAGDHTLTIRWTGEILEKLRGLYRSTRPGERYAATQFAAADARRAFPCFDEPEFKARFGLTLVHDASLAAIANMPVSRTSSIGAGRMVTEFAETPLISSYLLAFTVGPYEATPPAATATGVECRVWVPRGTAGQAVYARDSHVRAIEYLEEYTAIPYPFGKVDGIGVPDFEAGAMENPGAITYRTTYLAVDAEIAGVAAFKATFGVVAHELTHMWWGDLVTMAWWNDIWLNESFASFVGDKCTAALNPEWAFDREIVSQNAPAFALDALATTHPISMEAKNVDEANERFDAVTYNKGQGVLRMLESYLGEEVFRSGVRIYLDRHKWSNATAADFWTALDQASGRDVTALASAWITEPGHPVVSCTVRETDAGLTVDLTQERFFADPGASATAQIWPIPMVFRYGTATGEVREARYLLDAREGSADLPGATWYYPNGAGAGFYRTAFDDRTVTLLAAGIGSLTPEERQALLDNQWALARGDRATLGQVLELADAFRGETDLEVLRVLAEIVTWVGHHAATPSTDAPFRARVEQIFRPQLERLGWEPREHESTDDREARPIVILALGRTAAATDVRAEARRLVGRHLDGTHRLGPDIAAAVAAVAAAGGDERLYDRFVERMQAVAMTDAQEEARFRTALTDFEDPALANRTTGAIFSPLIRDQDRGLLLVRLLGTRHGRAPGWAGIKTSWETHVVKMDPLLKQRVVTAVSLLSPPDLATEATEFLRTHPSPDTHATAAQATERLKINAATAARMAAELETALGRVAQPAR
ncbi:MAG TPA: M1 family metallopeptidase [Candidatus Saccharimonadales bacterium]|nr:M1 family metallopeptidase [Candidatus Saccharimonadales bacterium]